MLPFTLNFHSSKRQKRRIYRDFLKFYDILFKITHLSTVGNKEIGVKASLHTYKCAVQRKNIIISKCSFYFSLFCFEVSGMKLFLLAGESGKALQGNLHNNNSLFKIYGKRNEFSKKRNNYMTVR